MNSIKKTLAGVAALAALGLGGAAIASATGGNASSAQSNDAPDQQLTGSTTQRAGDAAVGAVPGAKVASVEPADEPGVTAYEVKVTEPSGKLVEVGVSKTFTVTHQKAEDGGTEADGNDHESTGDHETGGDHGGPEANESGSDAETADDSGAVAQHESAGDGDTQTAAPPGATK